MLRRCAVASAAMLIFVSTFVACYNSFDDPQEGDPEDDIVANITTEELLRVVTSDGYIDVTEEITLRGYVSAHDRAGNFYKSFFIESGGYGVEVLEGLTYSYVRHPLGYEMVIYLNGLRLSRSSQSIVQIGVASDANSYYDIDYMSHEWFVDCHVVNTGYYSEVVPREFTLAELASDSDLAATLCGSLIRVTGVRYFNGDDDDDGVWSGERCFVSTSDPLLDGEAECAVWCYTSEYADFSGVEIPDTGGSITGILYGDTGDSSQSVAGWQMMIRPRSMDDLEF